MFKLESDVRRDPYIATVMKMRRMQKTPSLNANGISIPMKTRREFTRQSYKVDCFGNTKTLAMPRKRVVIQLI